MNEVQAPWQVGPRIRLNSCPLPLRRQDPHFVKLSQLYRPVPPDAGLRSALEPVIESVRHSVRVKALEIDELRAATLTGEAGAALAGAAVATRAALHAAFGKRSAAIQFIRPRPTSWRRRSSRWATRKPPGS